MKNQSTQSCGQIPAVVSDALLDAFCGAAQKVIRLRNDTKGAQLARFDSYAHTALVALNCAIDELEAEGAKIQIQTGGATPAAERNPMTDQNKTPAESSAPALSVVTGSVFEVVDATNTEQYFPVGLFATLAEAEKELAACKDPSDVGTPLDYDDFFAVEIRERKLGWHDHWKVAKRVEWKQTYDESADEYRWEILSPNTQVTHGRAQP